MHHTFSVSRFFCVAVALLCYLLATQASDNTAAAAITDSARVLSALERVTAQLDQLQTQYDALEARLLKAEIQSHKNTPALAYRFTSEIDHHLQDIVHSLKAGGYHRLADLSGANWDLLWSFRYPFSMHITKDQIRNIKPHQKVNHWPGIGYLTSKDTLSFCAKQLKQEMNDEALEITPRTFTLPRDLKAFAGEFTPIPKGALGTEHIQWIIKNPTHRGIHLIRSLDDVSHCTNDNKCLAQEYFHTHKVNHHKFDVGVYVVITDIEPLRAYFYDDVLIRVCKRAYPTTIEEFVNDEETWVINDYKPIWKVAEFQKHYNGNNRDTLKAYFDTVTPNGGETLLENLNDRIRKALLIALPRIKAATRKYPSRSNFFEMVRFDFLIGEDAVPKLIEVNMSPNLAPKNEVDGRMKRRLVDGLFELVGVTPSLAAASLKPFSSSSPSLPSSVSEEGTHDNGSDAPDDTSTETHEQECDELTSCVFDCPSECLVSCPVCFGYDSNEDGLNDAHNRLVAEYKRKPAVFGMLYPTKQHWKKYENYEKNMPSCLLPPVPVKKESSSSSSPSSSSSSSSSQQKPSPKRALLKFYKKISESVSDFTDTISTGHVYAFGAVYILGMATSLLLGKRTHNQSKNNGNIGGEEVDGNIDDGSDDGRDAYKEEEQVEDSVEEIQEPLDSDRKKKQ